MNLREKTCLSKWNFLRPALILKLKAIAEIYVFKRSKWKQTLWAMGKKQRHLSYLTKQIFAWIIFAYEAFSGFAWFYFCEWWIFFYLLTFFHSSLKLWKIRVTCQKSTFTCIKIRKLAFVGFFALLCSYIKYHYTLKERNEKVHYI